MMLPLKDDAMMIPVSLLICRSNTAKLSFLLLFSSFSSSARRGLAGVIEKKVTERQVHFGDDYSTGSYSFHITFGTPSLRSTAVMYYHVSTAPSVLLLLVSDYTNTNRLY